MRKPQGMILTLIAITGLGGCASMNSDECMTSDWSAIGYEDGVRGYAADRVGKHRKACAKHGVTLDLTAYQSGRSQGLIEYCQPSRGFNVGNSGGSYNGVCNAYYEDDFLDAYTTGRQLYTLRSNLSQADSAIRSRENELDRIEDDIRDKQAILISAATATEDRILLLVDLKDLSERTGELEAEIEDLREVRARNQVELEHFQLFVADLGY